MTDVAVDVVAALGKDCQVVPVRDCWDLKIVAIWSDCSLSALAVVVVVAVFVEGI